MRQKKLNRRDFLRLAATTATGVLAAACVPVTPQVVEVVKEVPVEKVVRETVVVEKVVRETGLPWKYRPLGVPYGGKEITLSYWDWHTPRVKMMERWFPRYTEMYPNVKFELSTMPWNDFWTKAKAAIPAGEAPDMHYFHQSQHQTFVWGGLLEPMPEELFPPGEMKQTFTALSGWLGPQGRIYWIPTGSMSCAIYYNKDMFEKEGLSGDDIPITWDEFLNFAKSLTKYDSAGRVEVSGFDVNGYEMATYIYMWRNHGIWLWDEAYTRPCYAQEEIIDALQWFVDLKEKHKVVDPDFLGFMDGFSAGKAYMVPGWGWFTGWLDVNQPQINYGVRRIPTLTGEFPPCTGHGSPDPQSIVVPVTGDPDRKMVAFDVIAFLYSDPDFLVDNSLTLGTPPVTPQIADHPLLKASESITAVTPQAEWLIYTHEQGAPLAVDAAYRMMNEGIFQTGMDVKEAVFKAQEESDRLTQEYIEEIGRENFQVSEREYIHADLMHFGKCLI